ncbi:MAG: DUF2254 domain-containing protein [Candidatus Scalindua sp. AMX11]|nr:MAG: DUF2254 domain-containing protein [Candidatus Scalindua sp.]NOG85919.1 DUF2254 domain-containing protein [Planctomycetota bacterium]RZV91446.1 MAG: DUF2254 domain-containing protein [Candidatus Scalindua sp. SCAELEC01]TDE66008.1 MAG: DUF2254 domain-containing protein [Candidatus Scalindua sp. AMX11]GJQ59314.1 MAG: hypothetical protein SCALA701_21150 [Candidatus Scalindua sp.]
MESTISADRLRFLINRLRKRLWVKPLAVCLLSVGAAFVAKLADDTALAQFVPKIALDSIETLLSVMAASMLVIATFSVASMVSAYASASSTATPRSFGLVVADDVSQNALSTFVGAFIFSIVALTAVKNAYFEKAGLFILFILTTMVFGMVIFTFVRWVDSIARLGRLGSTIDKVEKATVEALKRRRAAPSLYGMPEDKSRVRGQPVFAKNIGYVQHIDMAAIQVWAEEASARVVVAALPGTFAAPDRVLAYVSSSSGNRSEIDYTCAVESFQIGNERLFDDDPRFGLVVLSEIAGRALSPAVNDPGTAINIIGVLLRLFALWNDPPKGDDAKTCKYNLVEVPQISIRDMFDDAFTAISRDGAGTVEVAVRLQKALGTLTSIGHSEMRDAAIYHGQLALKRACKALDLDEDLAVVRDAASYAVSNASPGTGSSS